MRIRVFFSDNAVHEQELVVDKRNSTTRPSDDWKFASAVVEFAMLASDSKYLGTASLDDVLNRLDAMKLNEERLGFRDLVEMASAPSYPVEDAER